ncbi:MAG: hypothetical protein Tsb0020_28280 [Haliangiales bacterium]
MSLALGLALMALLSLALPTQTSAQPAATGAQPALGAHKQTLAAMRYQNLTLVPVVSTAAASGSRYLVLDEGMKSGKVRVVETENGGSVNELVLINRSSDPLFLLAGEVIIGGKQDRIIGKDMVIGANSRESIPVFCVEHGRWSGRKAEFSTAKALAHTKLRKKAKYSSQSEVWQEVSSKNAKRRVENDTDTYRRVATDRSVASSIAAYEAHFTQALAKLDQRDDMVGYVVALNGEIVAIETFGSPKLFRQLEDKLLRSYYVEAVDTPVDADGAKRTPSDKDIGAFRAKAKAARRAQSRTVVRGKAARTVQYDSADVEGSVVDATDEAERPADADRKAEPVYDSVFKKEPATARPGPAVDEANVYQPQQRLQRQQRLRR